MKERPLLSQTRQIVLKLLRSAVQVGAGELGTSAESWAGVAAGVTHHFASLACLHHLVCASFLALLSPACSQRRQEGTSLQKEPPGKHGLEGLGAQSGRQYGILRNENMVAITIGYSWKWMESRWLTASPAHTGLSKTCRAEEAEASFSCVTVKVCGGYKPEPGSNCPAWEVPACVCQPGAGTSWSAQPGHLRAQWAPS